jgi:hypothetical protein
LWGGGSGLDETAKRLLPHRVREKTGKKLPTLESLARERIAKQRESKAENLVVQEWDKVRD